jgi:hypothetical protein
MLCKKGKKQVKKKRKANSTKRFSNFQFCILKKKVLEEIQFLTLLL